MGAVINPAPAKHGANSATERRASEWKKAILHSESTVNAVRLMDTSTNLTAQRRRKKMTKVYQVRWFQTVEVSAPVDAQSEKEAVRLVRKGKYGERGVWQGNYQVIKSSIRAELDKNLMARFYPE